MATFHGVDISPLKGGRPVNLHTEYGGNVLGIRYELDDNSLLDIWRFQGEQQHRPSQLYWVNPIESNFSKVERGTVNRLIALKPILVGLSDAPLNMIYMVGKWIFGKHPLKDGIMVDNCEQNYSFCLSRAGVIKLVEYLDVIAQILDAPSSDQLVAMGY